jgi:hypothetical protein
MKKFRSYFIGVLISMAIMLGVGWFVGGAEHLRTLGVFFGGWIVGATSMFIKARMVY